MASEHLMGGHRENGVTTGFTVYDTESAHDVYHSPSIVTTDHRGSSSPSIALKIFFVVAIVVNVVVVALSVHAVASTSTLGYTSLLPETQAENREEGCGEERRERVMVSLCVPCVGEEEEEGEGWRRVKEEGREVCCSLDQQRLTAAVKQIFNTVTRTIQQTEANETEQAQTQALRWLEDDTSELRETLLFTNRHKPSGHVTGVDRFNVNQNDVADNEEQLVGDWPVQEEPYRSTSSGYVSRLTWGLQVPTTALYRLHSTLNLYFSCESRVPAQAQEAVLLVHQVLRYRARDEQTTVLTQRNQSVSANHCDGVTSFLMTLAELEVGDVIAISVSHSAALRMLDPWHSAGLFMVQ